MNDAVSLRCRVSELSAWDREKWSERKMREIVDEFRVTGANDATAYATALLTLSAKFEGNCVLKTRTYGVTPLGFEAFVGAFPLCSSMARIKSVSDVTVKLWDRNCAAIVVNFSQEAEDVMSRYATALHNWAAFHPIHILLLVFLRRIGQTLCAIASLVVLASGEEKPLVTAPVMAEAIGIYEVLMEMFEEVVLLDARINESEESTGRSVGTSAHGDLSSGVQFD